MELKQGVKLSGLKKQMVYALWVLENYLYPYSFIVTSGLDGKHSQGSLHYKGLALDVRTHHIPNEEKDFYAERIRKILGDNYDVILEDRDGLNEHLHIEWDPK